MAEHRLGGRAQSAALKPLTCREGESTFAEAVMTKYVCYKDATDLTHLVQHARAADPHVPVVLHITTDPGGEDVKERLAGSTKQAPVILELDPAMLEDAASPERVKEVTRQVVEAKSHLNEGDAAEEWRVIVTCPQDKCENAFSSEVKPDPASATTIVGYPPNLNDRFLTDAAKELAPDKSLARASDAAKFVISNIALVALVVGGFGVFGDTKGGIDEHRLLFGAIVVFAALSLGLALWALFPSTDKSLNYNDLTAVAKTYKEAIEARALLARLATGSLLLALILAVGAVFFADEANPTASISSSWDGSGERLILAVSVSAGSLPKDSSATAEISGLRGKQATTLTRTTTKPAKNGSMKIDLKTGATEYERYRVSSVIDWRKSDDGKRFERHRRDVVELSRPPFTPPPQAETQKGG